MRRYRALVSEVREVLILTDGEAEEETAITREVREVLILTDGEAEEVQGHGEGGT